MNLETQFNGFNRRKGQSAIEYLMTYGWMLLVVAIVGGAIFATVQGQCQQASSGFSGTDVRISDFGVDANGNMQIQLRNGASDPIVVNNVSIESQTTPGTFANMTAGNTVNLPVGSDGTALVDTFTGNSFSQVDGCNTFDLTINYDVTGGLSNQQISGTLTDSISLQ